MPVGEGDAAYCYALLHHALPIIEAFKPEIIFVACGLDAMAGDPYAHMDVTPEWFGWLAAELRERAIAPVVFNLEGGYSPESCAEAAAWVLKGLTVETADGMLKKLGLALDHLSEEEAAARETAYTYVRRRPAKDAGGGGARAAAGGGGSGEEDRVVVVEGPELDARGDIDAARETQLQMIDRRKNKKHGLRSPKLRSPTPSRKSPPQTTSDTDNSPCFVCGKKEWTRKASIQCSKCAAWVHCMCAGIKSKDAKKQAFSFQCVRCNPQSGAAAATATATAKPAAKAAKPAAKVAAPAAAASTAKGRKGRSGSGGGGGKSAAGDAKAEAKPARPARRASSTKDVARIPTDEQDDGVAEAEARSGVPGDELPTSPTTDALVNCSQCNTRCMYVGGSMACAADAPGEMETVVGGGGEAKVNYDDTTDTTVFVNTDALIPPSTASASERQAVSAAVLRVKSNERSRPSSAASAGSASSLTDMQVDASAPFGLTALISPLSSAPPALSSGGGVGAGYGGVGASDSDAAESDAERRSA